MAELEFGTLRDQATNALIDMMIRFYNLQKGTKCKVSNEHNRNVVADAIERANGDIVSLKNYIREAVKQEPSSLDDVFDSYQNASKAEAQQETKQVEVTTPQQVNNYMGLLEKAVVELVAKTNAKEIEERILKTKLKILLNKNMVQSKEKSIQ